MPWADPERRKRDYRERHARRKAAGLCSRCGRPLTEQIHVPGICTCRLLKTQRPVLPRVAGPLPVEGEEHPRGRTAGGNPATGHLSYTLGRRAPVCHLKRMEIVRSAGGKVIGYRCSICGKTEGRRCRKSMCFQYARPGQTTCEEHA